MDANRIAKTMLGTFDVVALKEWAAWWLAMDANANVSFALADRHAQTPMDAVIHAWLTNQRVPREDWSSIAEALVSGPAKAQRAGASAAAPATSVVERLTTKDLCTWEECESGWWDTDCKNTFGVPKVDALNDPIHPASGDLWAKAILTGKAGR
jgi:hypothetical protein